MLVAVSGVEVPQGKRRASDGTGICREVSGLGAAGSVVFAESGLIPRDSTTGLSGQALKTKPEMAARGSDDFLCGAVRIREDDGTPGHPKREKRAPASRQHGTVEEPPPEICREGADGAGL